MGFFLFIFEIYSRLMFLLVYFIQHSVFGRIVEVRPPLLSEYFQILPLSSLSPTTSPVPTGHSSAYKVKGIFPIVINVIFRGLGFLFRSA